MDGLQVYLDSSVVLRWLLEAPGAIPDWGAWQHAVASELMQVEVLRTLDRMRVRGEIRVSQLAACVEELGIWVTALEEVPLNRIVLRRAAAPFSMPIATLDAIHLATALLWVERRGKPLTFLTHDGQLALAARASGLEVRT